MFLKTVNARKLGQLPSTEQVIQDYKTLGGRLWITPNYFLYTSSLYKPLRFSFATIETLELVGNKITIRYRTATGIESTYFSLIKATEAMTVMQYLRYNPCSYVSLSLEGHSSSASKSARVIDSFLSLSLPKVDVESAAEGLRNIDDALEVGAATLEELARQAEMLDRIQHTAKNIGHNLDSAEHYIRGFSFGGGLRNLVTKNPAKRGHPSFRYMCRDVVLAAKAPEILQFSILLKRPDDSLQPSGLRFTPTHFEIFDPLSDVVDRSFCWAYGQIQQIVMRARPLHMDIRFEEGMPRFRMLTSYCQAITNELYLRSLGAKHEPEVIFEPNIPVFDYGSHRLTIVQGMDQAPLESKNPFVVPKAAVVTVSGRASDVLVGADEDTKRAFDEQQYLVGEIFEKTQQLKVMARTIGESVDASTEDIRLTSDVIRDSTDRIGQDTHRVTGLLR